MTPHRHGIDLGTPGASARREHARRKANRHRRTREQHPRLGGLLLAVQDEPQHERAWERGASGEEEVARELARRCTDDVIVLHDRAVPHSTTNLDHIAIAPSGVYVVDSKRYQGKVAVEKKLFAPAALKVAGRDQTKLARGLTGQVALVRGRVEAHSPGVPVHGVLCFVDAELPLLSTLRFDGHELLRPRRLARRLNVKGPLPHDRVRALAHALAEVFVRA